MDVQRNGGSLLRAIAVWRVEKLEDEKVNRVELNIRNTGLQLKKATLHFLSLAFSHLELCMYPEFNMLGVSLPLPVTASYVQWQQGNTQHNHFKICFPANFPQSVWSSVVAVWGRLQCT